ncbi:MAG TPA: VOC family protein, partial [Candidatus Eisenbacteria bacterium]
VPRRGRARDRVNGVLGLHHVTAIAGDPQRNLDFYAGLLGLRLVKRTVNFDDPQTYHFYFGDGTGTPGSLLTFFPWPGARAGRVGAGQVAVTSFAIRPDAVGFWSDRLAAHGIALEGPRPRRPGDGAEEVVLAFRDPDGLGLELVAHPAAAARPAWGEAPGIPAEHALHGLHAVTLWETGYPETERLLLGTLGFRPIAEHGDARRYAAGDGGPGRLVDVRATGAIARGAGGAGTVHHVAWRVADDPAQVDLRSRLVAAGQHPTPVIDRQYFHSVYFREPGGVLFEIATDPPGFAIDEPAERLGERLMLPPQFEPGRAAIEAILPPIHLPEARRASADGPAGGSARALGFVHRFEPPAEGARGAGGPALLLLHGTGGDENDLVPLGRALLPGAALLSPRGQVLEQGMPRFFRRLAEGVFDQEDLARRTDELAGFVTAAAAAYGLERERVIAVGFSNGANIAASVLLRHPGLLRAAVLLSPMTPFEPETVPNLEGTRVFVGAGRLDPVARPAQAERLAEILRRAGAEVTLHWTPGGHAVTEDEVEAARRWIARGLSPGNGGHRAA